MLDNIFQALISIAYFGVPLGLIFILVSGHHGGYKSVGLAIHFSFVAIRRGIRDYTGMDDTAFWADVHGVTVIIALLFVMYDMMEVAKRRHV